MSYELKEPDRSKVKPPHRGTPSQNSKPAKLPQLRLLLVWALMMAGSIGLLLNLYRLQVDQARLLEGKARQQQMVSLRPFVPRRPIVDRNGNVLAVDRPVYTLYAHPKFFKISKQKMAITLAPLLGKTASDLEKLFDKKIVEFA